MLQSLQWVVITSITIHIQWNLYITVPPMGSHHLHYYPYTVEPLRYGPSNGWSSPPLPSMYSGTSTLQSLQWVVITSITIHIQWNLYVTVPPMGGHHLHYHPCTVEPLRYGPSNGWSSPPLPSMCSLTSTLRSLHLFKVEPAMREGRCVRLVVNRCRILRWAWMNNKMYKWGGSQ